jgi:hypothetical protein
LSIAAGEAMAYADSSESRTAESGCSAAYAAASATELYAGERLIWVASRTAEQVRNTLYWSAQETLDSDGYLVATKGEADGIEASRAEEKVQAGLLRCIFGNPFRPVAFPPAWRSETAVALATAIYADRAFDRLPILADALEESGCDHSDVLAHCRGPGPHARGCWVVDAVLGKL